MQFLAILKLKPETTGDELGPLLKSEASEVWDMQCSGELRSIHYIAGPTGAVLLLETMDEATAAGRIRQLPMVARGLLSVEILALTPFTGFASLFA